MALPTIPIAIIRSDCLPKGVAVLVDGAAWKRYAEASTEDERRNAYEQIRASTATITGLNTDA